MALPGAGLRRAEERLEPLGGCSPQDGRGPFPITPEENGPEGGL